MTEDEIQAIDDDVFRRLDSLIERFDAMDSHDCIVLEILIPFLDAFVEVCKPFVAVLDATNEKWKASMDESITVANVVSHMTLLNTYNEAMKRFSYVFKAIGHWGAKQITVAQLEDYINKIEKK